MSTDGTEGLGASMGALRRDVEAAVRVPPYDVVLRRHHQRRRRRVGVGGLALAAVVAVGVTVLPGLSGPHRAGVTPTGRLSVSRPPVGGVRLADVSFDGAQDGTLLGQVCAQACYDVALASTDGGRSYGAPVSVPGTHRYVAALAGGARIAYAPDLALSADAGATWIALAAPAPVADVVVAAGRMWVLLTPAGAAAQLWSGPATATSWAAYREASAVPGSDASARLVRPSAGTLLVVSGGQAGPRSVVATVSGTAVSWQAERPVSVCGVGSAPSVSAVSAGTWWVACGGQLAAAGGQEVAVTADGGATYTGVARVPTDSTGQQVTALSARVAYLWGGPELLVTRDGGGSWQEALAQPSLGAPHVPLGSGGADAWVLAPGTSTVWRTTGSGWSALTDP